MPGISRAVSRRAYLSVGQEVGASCVEPLVVFVPSLPHPLLSTVYQCDGCLSYLGHGGSWLVCQVLPAISAVSILPIVVTPGCLGHATSTVSVSATKLFTLQDWILMKWYMKCIIQYIELQMWNQISYQAKKSDINLRRLNPVWLAFHYQFVP